MATPGSWPVGALPLGPSAYEEAMRPIYWEAVWRERNFYKADDGSAQSNGDPTEMSQPSVGMIETATAGVTDAFKGFGDFLRPAGQWNWWRVGCIVGGLVLVGYIVGRK